MALFNRFYDRFPNTDFSQINLDWIIEKLAKHEIQIQELFSQDIPTEVQNVMNEWLEDGTLADLINDDLLNSIFLSLQGDISALDTKLTASKTWKVETFGDIQDIGADLAAGDTVTTAGYYSVNDGGGAVYVITTSTDGIDVGGGLSLYAYPLSNRARAWGIQGDGSDETALVVKAVKTRRELDIQDLNITIDGTISLRHGFRLYGTNGKFTAKTSSSLTSGSYMFNVGGLNNVEIVGIEFDRNTQSVDFYAINATTATGLVVRNCTFSNGRGYMIRTSRASNTLIENCVVHDLTGAVGNPGGFIYMQGGHDLTVRGVIAYNLQDHVVYLDGSLETYDIFITDIQASDTVGAITNAAVVVLYGDVHDVMVSKVIARNVKTGFGAFTRTKNPYNYTIESCDLEATETAVSLLGTADTIGHIANANIVNCTLQGGTQDALDSRFISSVYVRNVLIKGATRYGIAFTGAADCFVNGCHIKGCATAIYAGARDSEEGVTSNGVFVFSNVCVVNNSYGIICQATVSRFYNYMNIVTGNQNDATKNFSIAGNAFNVGVPVNGTTQVRGIMWGTAAPTTGHHYQGDIVFDSTGATMGWVCRASGTPGTWQARA